MDPLTIGLLSVGGLFILILLGFHVGVALAITSFLGVYFITGQRLIVAGNLLKTTSFSAIGDYVFAVIPLFVLMGLLTTASGATRELFSAAEALLRRLRGGLGISTVAANAVFAAITGVSIASAAVFSKIAIPEMQRLKYSMRFSLGIVASSSLLGMLIPPSILMIIFAVITEQSIGRLFAAGVIPGILVAAALSFAIWLMVAIRPRLGGFGATAGDELQGQLEGWSRGIVLLRPWPIYILIVLVLGGIYGGIFTPTEAGAVGAFGALLLLISRRKFTLRTGVDLLLETGKATASIFFLLIAASMYSRMLALSRLPTAITDWVIALDMAPILVIVAFMLVLVVLGMILDSVSILLLTMPVMVPVAISIGYDPIWFGIVAIIAIELGLLTPPFGMVIFAMKAALPGDVRLEDIYAGSAPFLLVLVAVLGLLIAVPELSLFLPRLLFG
jgi:C4-dicarboxylate transporter, DctM subunit